MVMESYELCSKVKVLSTVESNKATAKFKVDSIRGWLVVAVIDIVAKPTVDPAESL